jgi:drug/metabolite transporter (DMT)-like permease
MIHFYALGVLVSILVALSQLLLKIGAIRNSEKSFIKQYLSLPVFVGYVLLFIVLVVNVYIYSGIQLRYSTIFMSFSYPIVVVLSSTVLREKISRQMTFGVILICLGAIIFIL